MGSHKTFICSACKSEYHWFMKDGTNKMHGGPVRYSQEHETECAYCKGFYPDGTSCNGGRKIKKEKK